MQLVGVQSLCYGIYLLFSGILQGDEKIMYLNQRTLNLPVKQVNLRVVDFESEISIDTLYQYISAEGFPIYYSRNIRTNVCFDNKCRLLDIIVYWNLTGRYLGFELPEEEYLSKTDHDPFTEEEYVRLNELLLNPTSPLGQYSYKELIMEAVSTTEEVDGVSGATSKEVLEFVVKGAAYTTHKLYEVIYGPTKTEIANWTKESFTSEFLTTLLQSENYSDVVWVLENIRGKLTLYPELRNQLFSFIEGADFTLSEKAIHVLVAADLEDIALQRNLADFAVSTDAGKRKWILELFQHTEQLHGNIPTIFNGAVSQLDVPSIVKLLEIYTVHKIQSKETIKMARTLSRSKNAYLANKASLYLTFLSAQTNTIY
ncbi:hypothetical protein SAMN05192553_10630 [Cyclobacterium xiamenense]|uniref:Uncharacterized protein n=1 Tax=Cyclobacterium xiamenense TaxID=1297121 RepID=A0A1H7AFS9_9BACT|nr:hypothetical protein [Cyclobacterium xiamenense]SEJ60750.1 hypothetical protein SAMN05192553_10630 [Cyclobacterium xiamenense]